MVRLLISPLNFWLITAAQGRSLGPTSRNVPRVALLAHVHLLSAHYENGTIYNHVAPIIAYPYHPKSDESLTPLVLSTGPMTEVVYLL